MKGTRSLVIVGVLCVLCMLALWLVGTALAPKNPFHAKHPGHFDRDEWLWLGQPEHPLSQRLTMLDDLKANHLRIGMTEADVSALLGYADLKTGPTEGTWRYAIEQSLTRDSWLVMQFNYLGALTSVDVTSEND